MKNTRLYRTEKNSNTLLPEKRVFPSFGFKVFFTNIFSKILRHMLKNTEVCSEFCNIIQISAKVLLKYFPHFLSFGSSQFDHGADVYLLNFAPTK